jgi:hypothetical protein
MLLDSGLRQVAHPGMTKVAEDETFSRHARYGAHDAA